MGWQNISYSEFQSPTGSRCSIHLPCSHFQKHVCWKYFSGPVYEGNALHLRLSSSFSIWYPNTSRNTDIILLANQNYTVFSLPYCPFTHFPVFRWDVFNLEWTPIRPQCTKKSTCTVLITQHMCTLWHAIFPLTKYVFWCTIQNKWLCVYTHTYICVAATGIILLLEVQVIYPTWLFLNENYIHSSNFLAPPNFLTLWLKTIVILTPLE